MNSEYDTGALGTGSLYGYGSIGSPYHHSDLGVNDDTSDLPSGWVQYESEDGWPYYYNAELNISSWERPSSVGGEQQWSYDEGTGAGEQSQSPTHADNSFFISELSGSAGLGEGYIEYTRAGDQYSETGSPAMHLNMSTISAHKSRQGTNTENDFTGQAPYSASSAMSAEEFFSPFSPASGRAGYVEQFSQASHSPQPVAGAGEEEPVFEEGDTELQPSEVSPLGDATDRGFNRSGHSLSVSDTPLLSPSALKASGRSSTDPEVTDNSEPTAQWPSADVEDAHGVQAGAQQYGTDGPGESQPAFRDLEHESEGPGFHRKDESTQQDLHGYADDDVEGGYLEQPLQPSGQGQRPTWDAQLPEASSLVGYTLESAPQPGPEQALPPLSRSPQVSPSRQMSSNHPFHLPQRPQYPQYLHYDQPSSELVNQVVHEHKPQHPLSRHSAHTHAMASPPTPSSGESELFRCLSSSVDGDGGSTPPVQLLRIGSGLTSVGSSASAATAPQQQSLHHSNGGEQYYAPQPHPHLQLVQQFPPPPLPPALTTETTSEASATALALDQPPAIEGSGGPAVERNRAEEGHVYYSRTADNVDISALISDDSDQEADQQWGYREDQTADWGGEQLGVTSYQARRQDPPSQLQQEGFPEQGQGDEGAYWGGSGVAGYAEDTQPNSYSAEGGWEGNTDQAEENALPSSQIYYGGAPVSLGAAVSGPDNADTSSSAGLESVPQGDLDRSTGQRYPDGAGPQELQRSLTADRWDYEGGGDWGTTEDGREPAPATDKGEDAAPAALTSHELAWLQYEQMRDVGSFPADTVDPASYQDQYYAEPYPQQAGPSSSTQQPSSKYGKLRSALQQSKSRARTAQQSQGNSEAGGAAPGYAEEEFYEAQPGSDGVAQQGWRGAGARWQQCVTAQGDVYYYNPDTQHVQWENPYDTATAYAQDEAFAGSEAVAEQQYEQYEHQPQSPTVDVAAPLTQPAPANSATPPSGRASILSPSPSVQTSAPPPTTAAAPRRGMVTRNSVTASGASSLSQAAPAASQTSSMVGTPPASVTSAPRSVREPSGRQAQTDTGNVIQNGASQGWSSIENRQVQQYSPPAAPPTSSGTYQDSTSPYYPQQDALADESDGEAEGEGEQEEEEDGREGDRSTVGSHMEMAASYNRHGPFGNRASTRSISSLSDNESSEYGYGSSVHSSVQGAFVLGAAYPHSANPSGRSFPYTPPPAPETPQSPGNSSDIYALSPDSQRQDAWPRGVSPNAAEQAIAFDNPDAASQASTESQKQRHLEIWDRFFRNAMLVSQRDDGHADESRLSRSAVSASIRKIRQKAAMSRSKGATAVARWPHQLPERRYSTLVQLALRMGGATEEHVSDADVAQLSAEERAVVESSSVTGSVSSVDGTLLSMALLAACLHEDLAAAEQLLQSGANPSCVDDLLRTPAHYCARSGQAALLALLCDHDADLEATDAAGRSPLHTAAIFGRTAVIEFLLGCAVDCNAGDLAGNAPLHLAARAGFAAGCALLLRFGASPQSRNLMGMTAQGVAQIMRPQTPALQEVLSILNNPVGIAETSSNKDERAADASRSVESRRHRVLQKAPVTGLESGAAAAETAVGRASTQGWQGFGAAQVLDRAVEFAAEVADEVVSSAVEAEDAAADPLDGADGVDGTEEVEEEEVVEEEDSSVAGVVASSVWGVAATLIDITLSMFTAPNKSANGNQGRSAGNTKPKAGWGLFSGAEKDPKPATLSEGGTPRLVCCCALLALTCLHLPVASRVVDGVPARSGGRAAHRQGAAREGAGLPRAGAPTGRGCFLPVQ
jgi:hypothetical protein